MVGHKLVEMIGRQPLRVRINSLWWLFGEKIMRQFIEVESYILCGLRVVVGRDFAE
jgi:hypothetical protein